MREWTESTAEAVISWKRIKKTGAGKSLPYSLPCQLPWQGLFLFVCHKNGVQYNSVELCRLKILEIMHIS